MDEVEKEEKLRMLHDLVLIRPAAKIGKTENGLVVIGDISRGAPQRGLVIDVGPGKIDAKGNRIVPPCFVGDIVIFSTTDVRLFEKNKETFYIVPSTEILMRVDLSDEQPAG